MVDNKYDYEGEDELEIMTLEFEDGKEVECEVIGIFEVEGKDYIALYALDESDEIYLYGYKELDDEEDDCELEDIEDDAEYEKVAAEFDRLMEAFDEEEDDE